MLRLPVELQKCSAVLLWRDEEGYFTPISFGKAKLISLLALSVVSTLIALSLGTYFLFKDNVLVMLVSKHHEQSIAYEERILKMSASLDRVSSKQLIDQDHFERKIGVIITRQAELEKKQQMVQNMSDRLGVKFDLPTSTTQPLPRATRPEPLDEIPTGSIRKSESMTSRFAKIFSGDIGFKAASTLNDVLQSVATSIATSEKKQITLVEGAAHHLTNQNAQLIEIFRELNLPVIKEAIGGVYIPFKADEADRFALMTLWVEQQFEKNALLKVTALNHPLARPLPFTHEITSGYGRRIDPFNRSLALHSGIDFRGNSGDSVRATARGKVVTSGVQGGYGNLVEIEHSNGFSTRYAHLSSLEVREGQLVEAGQLIGRVGSTGRSTGAHLHYEIRKDDEAQDPLHYLKLGARLSGK